MSTLRIMSFNVRGAYHKDDGINAWNNRAICNIETIQRYQPDLIGFQELQEPNRDAYGQFLAAYTHVLGKPAATSEPYEYVATYWHPDRLNLLDSGSFWLSETPYKHSLGWDAACTRAANWQRFQLIGTERIFVHLNTHLDHVGELARLEETKLIIQRLAEIDPGSLPVIITGDFNCDPGSPPYQLLLDSGFSDTYIEDQNASPYTFHGFGRIKQESANASGRIDWMMMRDPQGWLRPKTSMIIRDAQPPLYPSDHYPVLVEFEVLEA